jgi:hypothetical protein
MMSRMRHLLVLALLIAACGHAPPPAPKKKATDLTAGGKFHVVPGDGGAVYLIDPNVEACFLILPEQKPAGAVDCHKLKKAVPAAEAFIIWADPMATPSLAPPPIADVPPPAPPVAEPATDAGASVTPIGKDSYRISPALRDQFLAEPRDMRFVPAMKDGKSIGVKLYGIRKGSWPDKAGLKNGDLVRRINGLEVGEPDKALEMYQQVKTATNVDIELERKGKPVLLRYTVQ